MGVPPKDIYFLSVHLQTCRPYFISRFFHPAEPSVVSFHLQTVDLKFCRSYFVGIKSAPKFFHQQNQ